MLKLTDSTVKWHKNTADRLKGSARRMFMAETVQQLGYGRSKCRSGQIGLEQRDCSKRRERTEKRSDERSLFRERV